MIYLIDLRHWMVLGKRSHYRWPSLKEPSSEPYHQNNKLFLIEIPGVEDSLNKDDGELP